MPRTHFTEAETARYDRTHLAPIPRRSPTASGAYLWCCDCGVAERTEDRTRPTCSTCGLEMTLEAAPAEPRHGRRW